MARSLLRARKAVTLVEVVLSMVILSLTLTGIFSTYIFLNRKGAEPFIDYEINNLAQAIARDIERLSAVTPTEQCENDPLNFSDVCHWHLFSNSNTENDHYTTPYILTEGNYFNNQFPLLSSQELKFVANRAFQVTISSPNQNVDSVLSGTNCPGSSSGCTYKIFDVEISESQNQLLTGNKVKFRVRREVDVVGTESNSVKQKISEQIREIFYRNFNKLYSENSGQEKNVETGHLKDGEPRVLSIEFSSNISNDGYILSASGTGALGTCKSLMESLGKDSFESVHNENRWITTASTALWGKQTVCTYAYRYLKDGNTYYAGKFSYYNESGEVSVVEKY